MVKTAGLLLVAVLALGAARDIICQLACAEPDAAHAAAQCHESSDLGGTLIDAVADHCSIETSPATIAFKVGLLKDHSIAIARLASTPCNVTLPSRSHHNTATGGCRAPGNRTSVLRI